jgi:hypothetical protein
MDVFPIFRLLIPCAYILHTNKACFSENSREIEAMDSYVSRPKKMTIDSRATHTDDLMRTNDEDEHIVQVQREMQYKEQLRRKQTILSSQIPEEEDEDYYDEEEDFDHRDRS